MRSHFALAGVLLVVLASGCTSGADDPERTLPTAKPSTVVPDDPVTLSPTPASACDALTSGKVSKSGSGFIVELNIMSGLPNPAWRLSKDEGLELQTLLQTTQRGIDRDGPDRMGGFGVTVGRGAVDIVRRLELPERFWVQGDNKIMEFLGGTVPCNA